MRFKVTQRLLRNNPDLVWVVWDAEDHKIVSPETNGSYVACANACQELNRSIPETRLSQNTIDGKAEHRKGFFAALRGRTLRAMKLAT